MAETQGQILMGTQRKKAWGAAWREGRVIGAVNDFEMILFVNILNF